MKTTTLRHIKSFTPCESGWKTLRKGLGRKHLLDTPLPYADILRINGLNDAIWALRTDSTLAAHFAIRCALQYFKDERFVAWASAWLDGSDRSARSAESAAWSAARERQVAIYLELVS